MDGEGLLLLVGTFGGKTRGFKHGGKEKLHVVGAHPIMIGLAEAREPLPGGQGGGWRRGRGSRFAKAHRQGQPTL